MLYYLEGLTQHFSPVFSAQRNFIQSKIIKKKQKSGQQNFFLRFFQ